MVFFNGGILSRRPVLLEDGVKINVLIERLRRARPSGMRWFFRSMLRIRSACRRREVDAPEIAVLEQELYSVGVAPQPLGKQAYDAGIPVLGVAEQRDADLLVGHEFIAEEDLFAVAAQDQGLRRSDEVPAHGVNSGDLDRQFPSEAAAAPLFDVRRLSCHDSLAPGPLQAHTPSLGSSAGSVNGTLVTKLSQDSRRRSWQLLGLGGEAAHDADDGLLLIVVAPDRDHVAFILARRAGDDPALLRDHVVGLLRKLATVEVDYLLRRIGCPENEGIHRALRVPDAQISLLALSSGIDWYP